MGDFGVEAIARGNEGYESIGVEEIEDSTGCYLHYWSVNVSESGWCCGNALTSPPPMTRTRLLRTCHARIKDPPPCTSGNDSWSAIAVCGESAVSHVDDVDTLRKFDDKACECGSDESAMRETQELQFLLPPFDMTTIAILKNVGSNSCSSSHSHTVGVCCHSSRLRSLERRCQRGASPDGHFLGPSVCE